MLFWSLDPGWKKFRICIFMSLVKMFGLEMLKILCCWFGSGIPYLFDFGYGIRDGKIWIPNQQHCHREFYQAELEIIPTNCRRVLLLSSMRWAALTASSPTCPAVRPSSRIGCKSKNISLLKVSEWANFLLHFLGLAYLFTIRETGMGLRKYI